MSCGVARPLYSSPSLPPEQGLVVGVASSWSHLWGGCSVEGVAEGAGPDWPAGEWLL